MVGSSRSVLVAAGLVVALSGGSNPASATSTRHVTWSTAVGRICGRTKVERGPVRSRSPVTSARRLPEGFDASKHFLCPHPGRCWRPAGFGSSEVSRPCTPAATYASTRPSPPLRRADNGQTCHASLDDCCARPTRSVRRRCRSAGGWAFQTVPGAGRPIAPRRARDDLDGEDASVRVRVRSPRRE